MKQPVRLVDKFQRYLMIGVGNTLICFFIMFLGAKAGLDYLTYTALSYIIAMTVSFFMNLHVTFGAKGYLLYRIVLFFLINLINLLIVEIIEFQLIERFLVPEILAILTGMGFYVVSGFILNNYVTYRRKWA